MIEFALEFLEDKANFFSENFKVEYLENIEVIKILIEFTN